MTLTTSVTIIFKELVKEYNLTECSPSVINQFIEWYDQLLLNSVKDVAWEEYSKAKLSASIEEAKKEVETTDWPTPEMKIEYEKNIKLQERELQKLSDNVKSKKIDLDYSITMRNNFKSLIK